MLMRKVSIGLRVRRIVLACYVRSTCIIIFIEDDHISLFAEHDLSMNVCMELRPVIGRSKECHGDLVESRHQVLYDVMEKGMKRVGCRRWRSSDRIVRKKGARRYRRALEMMHYVLTPGKQDPSEEQPLNRASDAKWEQSFQENEIHWEGHIPVLTTSHYSQLTRRDQDTEWSGLVEVLKDLEGSNDIGTFQ